MLKPPIYYESRNTENETITKSTAITVVAVKIIFSAPRRVWNDSVSSPPPPNALPSAALVFWSKIPATSKTARNIWMYIKRFIVFL